MTETLSGDQARDIAKEWLECEPDLKNREEIEALLAGPESELIQRFTGHLEFGTAGLRGPLGAGPQRMNRPLVQMTAAAIAQRLLEDDQKESPLVVIGFDARKQSDVFASDTARVLANQNIRCVLLPRALPTPVLAFSVLQINASAGIMVTASHNPRQDNGYKVYWKDGAQINAPLDKEISTYLDGIKPNEVKLAPLDSPLITFDEGNLLEQYLDMAASCVSKVPDSELKIMYTPIHGVGKDTLIEAFTKSGFSSVDVVTEQADPDPDFPTVEFPNPEVPGTLDLALAEAKKMHADLVLANDPDADRLAVVVPDGEAWRTFNGNEIGALLAEHLLKSSEGSDRLVVTTIVSSRMLKEIAKHHGVHYEETLTGFKWIMRPGIDSQEKNFIFGYEEALGFAVGDHVHDKDGITSALVFAELAAEAKQQGKSVVDRLHDLWVRHGVHVTGQITHRFEGSEGADVMMQIMNLIRQNPPQKIGSCDVEEVTDFLSQESGLPPTNAVALETGQSRVVVRPSGTEPLIKIYAEVVTPVGDKGVDEAQKLAETELEDALKSVSDLLG